MGSSLSLFSSLVVMMCVCVCVCACVVLPHRELSARSEPVAEWFCQPAKLSWITLKWAPGVAPTSVQLSTVMELLSFLFHLHPQFLPLILHLHPPWHPPDYLQEMAESAAKSWTAHDKQKKGSWKEWFQKKQTADLCRNAGRNGRTLGSASCYLSPWERFSSLQPSGVFPLHRSYSI